MRNFKIHFSRSTKTFNQFSEVLQWYEGLPISHVLVEFETASHLGRDFVYHSAIGSGVSFMARDRFDKINEIMETYEIELPDEEYKIMRNSLLANCGESYAMMQNLGVLLVDTARRMGIPMSNPWKDGQNCSELIYRHVIPYICDKVENKYDPDLVKPSEIRKILKEHDIEPIMSKIDR